MRRHDATLHSDGVNGAARDVSVKHREKSREIGNVNGSDGATHPAEAGPIVMLYAPPTEYRIAHGTFLPDRLGR